MLFRNTNFGRLTDTAQTPRTARATTIRAVTQQSFPSAKQVPTKQNLTLGSADECIKTVEATVKTQQTSAISIERTSLAPTQERSQQNTFSRENATESADRILPSNKLKMPANNSSKHIVITGSKDEVSV